ncbi:HAD-IIB family hydrolase [Rossellomorea yichunensis]|jgi:Cof subfamily protein (haloacid dehalogenase superfamily)|uniref:HAD-IIB family hydrolase n=1 Tax=Rossellomorea yichunensis TaxID=3077331 RepID=UPI0028DEC190|nr:HAD-IIB family hydrolase [Rossellomorea sp. YC4-1]MDT9025510.1 HAD-IIB family hydrolase [Rossellomorea sp. YC4-1]
MIFVFDLDGTICFKGKPLTQEICDALNVCKQQGHEIVFASARPIRDLLPVLPEDFRHYRMVGGNGAFTYADQEIKTRTFTAETVNHIKQIIETNQLTYLIDSDWDYSYTGNRHHPIFRNLDPEKSAVNQPLAQLLKITKIVLFTRDQAIKQQLEKLSVQVYEHGDEELMDISPIGIHKVEGLRQLGILPGEFIAFGNDQNDLELFQNAKYSVCVGEHPIKEHASTSIRIENVPFKIKEISELYQQRGLILES